MNGIIERHYHVVVSLFRMTSLSSAVSRRALSKTRSLQTHISSVVVRWPSLVPNRSLSLKNSEAKFGRRSFTSRLNPTDFQNDAVASSSTSLPISSQVNTLNERGGTSPDMVRSQRPTDKFNKNRSDQEWKQLHLKIMSSSAKDKMLNQMDVVDAVQCMWWWDAQCRLYLPKDERYKNFVMSEEHSKLAVHAIVSAFDLFGRIVSEIEAQPELIRIDPSIRVTTIEKELSNWYNGHLEIPKATFLLNALLGAWKNCCLSINRNNNLPTPQSMFSLLKDKWSDLVPMNNRTYNLVVLATKQLGNAQPKDEVPLFCEKVIDFMFEKKRPKEVPGHSPQFWSESMSTLPYNLTYATALNAWAKSGRPDAASRAENLFNQFTTLCNNGIIVSTPDTACYNTLLLAMTTPSNIHLKYRPILLQRMVNPDETLDQTMVDDVLNRWTTLHRAEDVLRTMQQLPYPYVIANTISFRTMIYAWAEYSVDLRYIDRKKSLDAINRAKELLFEMCKLHVDGKNDAVQVDRNFFSKIVTTLLSNQPRVINDHVKADFRLAEEIYQYMLSLYSTTGDERFNPDREFRGLMILLYAKNGRPLEADSLLVQLEEQALQNDKISFLPSTAHYTETLFSFLNIAEGEINSGKHDDAGMLASKAESIIFRMIDIAVATNDTKRVPYRTTILLMFEIWISCRMPQRAMNYFRTIKKYHETTQHGNLLFPLPDYLRR